MTNFVIFGASGDLAFNYLFPALHSLWLKGHCFNYVGYGRTPLSATDFQSIVAKSTKNQEFAQQFSYISGGYDPSGLDQLKKLTGKTIFYSALPTRLEVIKPLVSGLATLPVFQQHQATLVIEKPFGHDSHSAQALMDFLNKSLGSEAVFLVDHYLTKDLVKNILTLRFANQIFTQLWQQSNIQEILITAIEDKGIEDRGEYYDQTGAIRDVVQNHCLQLLALITMSQPKNFDSLDYSTQKLAIFNHLHLFSSWQKSVQIGQYHGYLQENAIAKNSTTETMAKLKFKINLPDWQGIPITITTGKKLEKKLTEIVIVFKNDNPLLVPNQLTINLYPDNDIILTINSNFHSHTDLPTPVELRLGHLDPASISLSPYANVILDVLHNNRLNSPSFAEIIAQWQIVDKILAIPKLRQTLFCY